MPVEVDETWGGGATRLRYRSDILDERDEREKKQRAEDQRIKTENLRNAVELNRQQIEWERERDARVAQERAERAVIDQEARALNEQRDRADAVKERADILRSEDAALPNPTPIEPGARRLTQDQIDSAAMASKIEGHYAEES